MGAAGQPRDAEPPAAEREVLGQARGDHGPLRRHLRRAEERRRGGVRQVAVDLVGDDEQVVSFRDGAQLADAVRARQRPSRVVGQRDDDRADPAPGAAGGGHRAGQQVRVGHAARPVRDRHVHRPDTGQRRLRGVADPARPGDRHVHPVQPQQQPEQQRLAPRPAHHVAWRGRQPAPRPVSGDGRAQVGGARHRPVRVLEAGGGERVPQHGCDRHARLAECQRQHPLTAPPSLRERFVRGEGGGNTNDWVYRWCFLLIYGEDGQWRGDGHEEWHS